VVLLDRGVLVVDVEARCDVLCDHPGPEPAWGVASYLAVEDQLDPVRAAEVEVVADDLLEDRRIGPVLGRYEGESMRQRRA